MGAKLVYEDSRGNTHPSAEDADQVLLSELYCDRRKAELAWRREMVKWRDSVVAHVADLVGE